MNQSQFLAVTCNSPEAREKSRVLGAIGFGFTSHWLKNWRESFKPITKRSNRNHVITFDSHLKTTLMSKTNTKYPNQSQQERTARRTNQNSKKLPLTGNKAREKSRLQVEIGFAFHYFKNWCTIFKHHYSIASLLLMVI